MTVAFRRLIRSKGSNSARLVGNTHQTVDLTALITHARKTKRVYAFIDSQGNEGTIRSGRLMRRVDAHVRNSLTVGLAIQRPLDFSETVVEVLNDLDVKPVEENPFEKVGNEFAAMFAEQNQKIEEALSLISLSKE